VHCSVSSYCLAAIFLLLSTPLLFYDGVDDDYVTKLFFVLMWLTGQWCVCMLHRDYSANWWRLHFRDCELLLVRSLIHVSSAVASVHCILSYISVACIINTSLDLL